MPELDSLFFSFLQMETGGQISKTGDWVTSHSFGAAFWSFFSLLRLW